MLDKLKKFELRLFKTGLERLIFRKALILLAISAVIFSVFFNSRFIIIAGLMAGSVFSIIRLKSMTSALRGMMPGKNASGAVAKNILGFVIAQMVAVVLLLCASIINFGLFAGIAFGILIVPFSIFINALTESFGITHNHFE